MAALVRWLMRSSVLRIEAFSSVSDGVGDDLAHGVFEVEFSDDDGCTLALLAVPAERLMVLHYDLAETG